MRRLRVITSHSFSASARARADLRIYHIDVGQGDSTLILGPTGIACLVDRGDVDTEPTTSCRCSTSSA